MRDPFDAQPSPLFPESGRRTLRFRHCSIDDQQPSPVLSAGLMLESQPEARQTRDRAGLVAIILETEAVLATRGYTLSDWPDLPDTIRRTALAQVFAPVPPVRRGAMVLTYDAVLMMACAADNPEPGPRVA